MARISQAQGTPATRSQIETEVKRYFARLYPSPPLNKSAFNRFIHDCRIARALDPTLPAYTRRRALNTIKADDLV